MSSTAIDTTKISTSLGIKIGQHNAPNTLVEFVNLRCPYCKQWWDDKKDLISEQVKSGNLHYVIKLFNKENPVLVTGNIMHQYVPNNETAVEVISKMYDTQNDWGYLTTEADVISFAENTLGLTKQDNNDMLNQIITEATEANVKFVPTLVVDNVDFDQKISNEEFLALFKK